MNPPDRLPLVAPVIVSPVPVKMDPFPRTVAFTEETLSGMTVPAGAAPAALLNDQRLARGARADRHPSIRKPTTRTGNENRLRRGDGRDMREWVFRRIRLPGSRATAIIIAISLILKASNRTYDCKIGQTLPLLCHISHFRMPFHPLVIPFDS